MSDKFILSEKKGPLSFFRLIIFILKMCWMCIGLLVILNGYHHQNTGELIDNKLFYLFMFFAVVLFPLILYIIAALLWSEKKYVRGTKFTSVKKLKREFRRRRERTFLPLGLFDMPVSLENRHIFTIGLPGTGKSNMIRQIVEALYGRGDKCVIFDTKGEFFGEFFNPQRDLLFNPLDRRSIGWNIFNELEYYTDIEALAASLIPPALSTESLFWRDAARGVFTGVLHYLYQNNMRSNADLWRMLTEDGAILFHKLSQTKGGESGARYLARDDHSSRQADSVLATLMQFTKSFEFMAGTDDGAFNIRRWLNIAGDGCIYITNHEDIADTLRPVLSLFIDLLARKLLSMPDDGNRRIFFIIDEFGSLQRLTSIVNLLTRGRSKGAAVFLGIQDDGQISKIYTPDLLRTIENSCGSRVTFAVTGETAMREARNIGQTEVMFFTDNEKKHEHRETGLSILPSQIGNLKDLEAVVKLRGYDYTLSRWQYESSIQKNERFIIRKDLSLTSMPVESSRLKVAR